MKNKMKQLEWLCLLDIILLPVYLIAYQTLEIMFWIIIILVDCYMVNVFDRQMMISLLQDVQRQSESRRTLFFNIAYMIGLGVVAFKNLKLAGILLLNEGLLLLVVLINDKKADKK